MLHLILYQPEMAGNTGNVMRTAAALGARLHLIGPFPFPLYSRELARAALDYGQLLTYEIHDNYDAFINKEKPQCLWMISRYGQKAYHEIDFTKRRELYVMFGSESTGIPREILKNNREHVLRIPMKPAARSLNLANSVAIVAYEIMRQKQFEGCALKEILKGEDYLS